MINFLLELFTSIGKMRSRFFEKGKGTRIFYLIITIIFSLISIASVYGTFTVVARTISSATILVSWVLIIILAVLAVTMFAYSFIYYVLLCIWASKIVKKGESKIFHILYAILSIIFLVLMIVGVIFASGI